MGYRPRVLVCEQDAAFNEHLSQTLATAGFWTEPAHSTREALKKLATHHYHALTLSVLLGDQDCLSFSQELRILGMRMPILIVSAREPHRLATSANLSPIPESMPHPEPDWVRKAVDQARFIFAVKSACQRSRELHPRILHLEADRFSAELVRAALRDSAEVIQVSDGPELDTALDAPVYDLALLNADTMETKGEAALHRIAALCPETPIVLQAHVNTNQAFQPTRALSLVTALRTLLLHAMQVPQRAQA